MYGDTVEVGRKGVDVKMNLLLMLIAVAAVPALGRIVAGMARLLIEMIGGLVILAVIAVLLLLVTHGKVL